MNDQIEHVSKGELLGHIRGERPLWMIVAANTWWHYREHCQTIEAWMEE